MPLKRSGTLTAPAETGIPAPKPQETAQTAIQAALAAPLTPPVTTASKTAPAGARARSGAPLTKDEYWNRREERDIRTGECIRLSGVMQALLGSVNYGQFATSNDKDAYLAQVKADAKMLAKFITDEA